MLSGVASVVIAIGALRLSQATRNAIERLARMSRPRAGHQVVAHELRRRPSQGEEEAMRLQFEAAGLSRCLFEAYFAVGRPQSGGEVSA